jgi:hypothetical protein
MNTSEPATAPPIVHNVERSPGQPVGLANRAFVEPRFVNEFSRVRVHPAQTVARYIESADRVNDDEEEEEEEDNGEASGEELSQAEGAPGESGTQEEIAGDPTAGSQPSGGPAPAIPAAACPSSTEVVKITDLTPAGLKAGYLTAYGALATMRVLPKETNWDGVRIAESLTRDSASTCPIGLTAQPCVGGPPFTVGDGSKGSSVLLPQPGQQNRFYDFHRTRSDISLLHIAARNPKGMNLCTMICNQSYSCGGTVIGKHSITRTFTKGTYDGKDVTLVSVTKT